MNHLVRSRIVPSVHLFIRCAPYRTCACVYRLGSVGDFVPSKPPTSQRDVKCW